MYSQSWAASTTETPLQTPHTPITPSLGIPGVPKTPHLDDTETPLDGGDEEADTPHYPVETPKTPMEGGGDWFVICTTL